NIVDVAQRHLRDSYRPSLEQGIEASIWQNEATSKYFENSISIAVYMRELIYESITLATIQENGKYQSSDRLFI
ncbi:MAG: hypothetical protein AAF316_06760, partial [Cyanobacteria bacterium P01_A01_bin.80]